MRQGMVRETQQTIITDPETSIQKAFTFDFSYNSFVSPSDPDYASQQTVWEDIGVKVLEHAWNGFNVSLFAYGQTGSGKSFSMVGYGKDKGIIPMATKVLFERIEANTSEIVFKVEASMMEIYNERIKDLFNPSMDNLKVRDHPSQGPYAESLTHSAVSSHLEIERLMNAGILARTTASTNMNATSSRAHTIFQIIVTQSELNRSSGKVMDKKSRINLIDLAGSERAASTGASGSRLKEGAAINQSLSALGNCISALADQANGKKVMVPYRNSKLTHLLKDSFGGNAKTIMIAALSPATINYSETLGTLRYADRAKQIKNKAIVNEDPNHLLIRQLKEELEILRKSITENTDFRPPSRELGGGTEEAYSGELNELISRRINPAREQELAAIREQLEENQRLLQESEKTWTERLKETEELAKKREEQLKTLGLVSNTSELKDKAVTNPHLLNLNEDQQMSEKLVYCINVGCNKIGRIDADGDQNIILGGLGIMKEHCMITRRGQCHHTKDKAYIGPPRELSLLFITVYSGAKVFVNAELLKDGEDVELHHCDRLVLGNSNIFRVVIPSARSEIPTADELLHESSFDWQYAIKEHNKKHIKATLEAEVIAEKEKREMDARMQKMEEMLHMEQNAAEEKLGKQREEWEQHVRALSEEMREKELEIKTQMQAQGDNEKKKLAEQLALQKSKLVEELVKAEIIFETKQQELVERQKELEGSLQRQLREAKVLGSRKERERVERAMFDDLLLQSIPLVNEANSIADELEKKTLFTLHLITSGPTLAALSETVENLEDEEIVVSNGTGAELKVEVNFQESGTFRSVMWDVEYFHVNVYAMREMYQMFIEHNRSSTFAETWSRTYGDDCDPFCDPPGPQLIGKSFIFLKNLVFGCPIKETTPIFNQMGGSSGSVKCAITPTVLSHEWQACQNRLVENCPDNIETLSLPTLTSFVGSNLRLNIYIESLRGIPGKLCKDASVSFKWGETHQEQGKHVEYRSERTSSSSVDPHVDFHVLIEEKITLELVNFLACSPLELCVYGIVPSSNLTKVVSHALILKNTPSSAKLLEGDASVLFYNADANGRNTLLSQKKSTRLRKDIRMGSDSLDATLQQYRQQLVVQGQTLAENTLQLEYKSQEVVTLQQYLEFERTQNTDLRCALETYKRMNDFLTTKVEQQILNDTTNFPTSECKRELTLSTNDLFLKSSRNEAERPTTTVKRESMLKPGDFENGAIELARVGPVLIQSSKLADTLSSNETDESGQHYGHGDISKTSATMSKLSTSQAMAVSSESLQSFLVPKKMDTLRRSICSIM